MITISNEMLQEAYHMAREVDVEEDFIRLLEEEINRRGLVLEDNKTKIEA